MLNYPRSSYELHAWLWWWDAFFRLHEHVFSYTSYMKCENCNHRVGEHWLLQINSQAQLKLSIILIMSSVVRRDQKF